MEPPPSQASKTAIVLAGGDPVDGSLAAQLPGGAAVIAADSGLHHAAELGLVPSVVIGDMDSVDPRVLDAAIVAGAIIERHPADKDATDLELALRWACNAGYGRIIMVGGHGGRIDHLLGNALALTSQDLIGINIEWWIRTTRLFVVRSHVVIDGAVGDIVTLLAVGGDANGITTTGLRWQLNKASLASGSTHGISNELVAPSASVTVEQGVLVVIHIKETDE